MANPNNTWKKKVNHGQPKVSDPRWNHDPDAIYQFIHIQRRRAWVLWKNTNSLYFYTPPVGLVVKPLDTYTHVLAFIPWENNNSNTNRPLAPYSDFKFEFVATGDFRPGQGIQYPTPLNFSHR